MSPDARDALRMSHMRLQQRCHDAESHVERLLRENEQQAETIQQLMAEIDRLSRGEQERMKAAG